MGKINDNNGYLTSNLHNFTPKKIINSNHITTQGMAFPIQANGINLYPNTGDYIFNTNKVIETPLINNTMIKRTHRPTFQMGGQQESPQDQIMQMVAQALQQGTPPEQVMQMLVQQGIPQEQAQQIIQEVMSQMQGQMSQQPMTNDQQQPMMQQGGILQHLQKGGNKANQGMVDTSAGWKDFNIDPYREQINSNITPEMFKQYEDYYRGYKKNGKISGTDRAQPIMIGGLDDNYYNNVANITGTDMTRLPGFSGGQSAQYAYGDQAFADAYNKYADQRNQQFANNALSEGQAYQDKFNTSRYQNPLKRLAHSVFHRNKYKNEIKGISDGLQKSLTDYNNYSTGNYEFQQGGSVAEVTSDADSYYKQLYKNPRYVVDAANGYEMMPNQEGLLPNNSSISDLNQAMSGMQDQTGVFNQLKKPLKSIQRAKVPTFNNTKFGDAFNKARSQGAKTFLHNGKLYTTELANKTKNVQATKPVGTGTVADWFQGSINKTKKPNGNAMSFTLNTPGYKLNKQYPTGSINPTNSQGMISKGWEILNNPVKAFSYAANNQRMPDHFSSGNNGRDAYDMALEIPKLGIPIGAGINYLKGLGNSSSIKVANKLTNAIATQLPKLVKNPGAMQAKITGYLNQLRRIGGIETEQLKDMVENLAKNPSQYKKLMKMIQQTHVMDLQ